jgi:hypothetical protein
MECNLLRVACKTLNQVMNVKIFFPLLGCYLASSALFSQTAGEDMVHCTVQGTVSIEAEHFNTACGFNIRNYYTGVGITTAPKTTPDADSAFYLVDFESPGTYFLHVLGSPGANTPAGNNALTFVLRDLNQHVIDTSVSGFLPINVPAWSSFDYIHPDQANRMIIPSPGRYLLSMSPFKGEGMYIDKIVLSGNPDDPPTGTGPEETCLEGCETGERNRIILPPGWVFGVLYGGYTNQQQTLEVVDSLISGGFPIDAYWIDSYFWDFNLGKGPKGYLDFTGDTTAFPDVGKLWGAFEERKIKSGIWIWDQILETGNEAVYQDFLRRGFFSTTFLNKNGWHNATKNTMTGVIDFSNPDAVEYWKMKMKPFFDRGLDFLKLDNSSAMDYCRAAFTATQELGKETLGRGFILAHLHTTGAYEHKRYPTKWTGDAKIAWTQPDYPDMSVYAMGGLKENIYMVSDPRRSTYEVPFLSHDAGGYDYFGSKDQSEELYTRWIQFSSMNSVMMFFSQSSNPTRNHPYRYSEQVQQNFRKYTHLRMQLFPYIYTYAIQTHLTGKKMIRGDAKHELQYLLGDEILVAPVYEKGATSRKLYLPEGEWIDIEDKKIYEGDREVILDAPVEKLPLLFRVGAIIPMRNYARAVELGSNDTLILEIYPSGKLTSFDLLEDDGLSNDYLKGEIASTTYSVRKTGDKVDFTIHPVSGSYNGMKAERVYLLHFNGTSKPKWIRLNGKKYLHRATYHPDQQCTEIVLPVKKTDLQQVVLNY